MDELRSRTSLVQVVGRKVLWDNRKSNPGKGDMWSPCPFHHEKTASFHVDDQKGFYYCFGCHAKGDAINFVQETENVSFVEAVKILAEEAGMQMPDRDPKAQEKADRHSQLIEVMDLAVKFFRMSLNTAAAGDARAYLERRGLSQATQDRFDIGFAPDGWQNLWDEADVFRADDSSDKPKFYALEMFPYPSGRIHMGHVRNYAMGDVIARYKKAQGFEVLHPMGWDSFGMPAENAAIATGGHPKDWTYGNIDAMKAPMKRLGFALDWSREFATSDEAYYKQQQAIFLKFWERGLIYRKTAKVNWDPVDNTVLANEQVIDGKGWRSGAVVEQRDMDQWFFKITHYAEELLEELGNLSRWPEKVKTMQTNWIGKSEGLQMTFKGDAEIDVFTTRPDTLFGASFIALSPDHPITEKLAASNPDIEAFRKDCAKIGTTEEAIATAETQETEVWTFLRMRISGWCRGTH